MAYKPKRIFIHHSAGNSKETVESINLYHKSIGYKKSSLGYHVGYNYVIEADGKVTQTRKDGEVGAHTRNFNYEIGICLVGNFSRDIPSEAQKTALQELIWEKMDKYGIPEENVLPHRLAWGNSTACFGDNLSDQWLATLIQKQPKGLYKNPNEPEVYYYDGEEYTWIQSMDTLRWGQRLGFWGKETSIKDIDEPIIHRYEVDASQAI